MKTIEMKKAKLLSAVAVLAMVFAVFAAIPMVADESDATPVAAEKPTDVGSYKVHYESSLSAVSSGNTVTFEGYATAGYVAGEKSYFSAMFGTERTGNFAGVYITGISGDKVYIKQTNSALTEAYNESAVTYPNDVKEKYYTSTDFGEGVEDPYYAFLIPQDASSVTIQIGIYTIEGTAPTELTTLVFNFSKVSTKIGLSNATSGDGWTFQSGETPAKLALDNYTGNALFNSVQATEVELTGTNTINNYAKTPVSAINTYNGGALTIKSGTTAGTLIINCAGDDSYGIMGSTIVIGDASGKKTTLNIDGGNRAIFSASTLTTNNADITASGAERAIRTNGNMTVEAKTTINATLTIPSKANDEGDDDYMGIKVGGAFNVKADATVNTQGLRVEGESFGNAGIVVVSGDYTQNPNAKGVLVKIAGLYLDKASYEGTANRVSVAGTTAGLYLIDNAGVFGYVATIVDEAGKKVVTKTNVSEVEDAFKDTSVSEVIVVLSAVTDTTTTLTVPEGKVVTIVAAEGKAFNGTVTIGGSESSAVFADMVGSFSISKGSVKLSGATINDGTVTLNERETLDIDVESIGNLNVVLATGATKAYVSVSTDVAINGTLSIGSKITMTNAGTITLGSSGKIDVAQDAVLKNNGNIIGQTGEITGQGTFDNSGTAGCIVSVANVIGTTYDIEMSGEAVQDRTYGALQNVIVPAGKTWTITTGTTITINGNLIVEGNVIIDGDLVVAGSGAGVAKLTVDNGATLVINERGKLTIGGATPLGAGDAVIDGDVTVNGILNVLKTSTTVAIGTNNNVADGVAVNGSMTVTSTGVASTAADARVTVYGTFTMNGSFGYESNGFALYDNGTVVINNAASERPTGVTGNGSATVNLAADGVSVEVVSFLFEKSTSALTITDAGLVLKKATKTNSAIVLDAAATNEVVLSMNAAFSPNLQKATVGAVTVTENVSAKKGTESGHTDDNVYTAKMDVAGTVAAGFTFNASASASTPVSDRVKMTITGGANTSYTTGNTPNYKFVRGATVATEVTLGNYVILENAGALTVSGTVSALGADGVIQQIVNSADGKLTVTGLVTASKAINNSGKIIAAYYVIITGTGVNAVTTYNYSTLGTAVAAVADTSNNNASKVVTIYGDLVVKENVDVPAGVTVSFDTEAKMTVGPKTNGQDVVVKFASGAIMSSAEGQIVVFGTLEFANKANDKTRDVICDVTVRSEEKNGPVSYTNLLTALENAADGSTVEVTRQSGHVTLTANLTIREGVTLYIPDGVASLKLNNGVTLKIDGTLKTESEITAETKFSTTAMDVDAAGTTAAKKSSAIVVNGYLLVNKSVANAIEYGDASTVAADTSKMTKGAPIAGAYYVYDNDWNVISTLENAIAVMDKITSSAITINGPISAGDIVFNGNEDCTKIIVGTTVVHNMDATDVVTSLTAGSLTIADGMEFGAVNNGAFTGSVVVGDASVAAVKATDLYAKNVEGKLVLNGTTKADGKDTSFAIATGTVYAGTTSATYVMKGANFTIATGATLEVVGVFTFETLTVDGTLVVPSGKTATANTNDTDSLIVNGTLSVAAETESKAAGTLTVKNLYVGLVKDDLVTGASATVNGPIGVSNIAYVKAGSAVDAVAQKVLDAKLNTQYFVADALWMTAYDFTTDNHNVVSAVTDAPVKDAAFKGWLDSDGKLIFNNGNDNTTDDNDPKIGAEKAKKVTAYIEYDIYKVFVYANEGIANVYIDSNLMQKGYINENGQTVQGYFLMVAAGEHKITYDLTNGWTGTAVFKVNGDAISGNTFSTSGDVVVYDIQVSGLEKSGYVPDSPDTDDSGMTITDYLLIVLVVLIIVMAIIVAMRMMRS